MGSDPSRSRPAVSQMAALSASIAIEACRVDMPEGEGDILSGFLGCFGFSHSKSIQFVTMLAVNLPTFGEIHRSRISLLLLINPFA